VVKCEMESEAAVQSTPQQPVESDKKDIPSQPRPIQATSIPSLLAIMQNEWDNVMQECFNLRKNLTETREELSQALYQYEAARRVIARLMRENEELKAQLKQGVIAPTATSMEAEISSPTGITPEIVDHIKQVSEPLFQARKEKNRAETKKMKTEEGQKEFAEVCEKVKSLKLAKSFTPHSAAKPGILACDVKDMKVLTGGVDGDVKVFDVAEGQVSSTMKGHKGKVTAVSFYEDNCAITSGADQKTMIWAPSASGMEVKGTVSAHSKGVIDHTVHPGNRFMVSVGKDGDANFIDILSASVVTSYHQDEAFTKCCFHPDGKFVAVGDESGVVQMLNIETWPTAVARLPKTGPQVAGFAMSNNGYYVGVSYLDNSVDVIDIRKLSTLHTFTTEGPCKTNAISFDPTGSFIAIGSNSIDIYSIHDWSPVCKLSDHDDAITCVKLYDSAESCVSTSMDRKLNYYC